MGGSLRIFSVRGIDIKVHITFPLILVWAAIQFGGLSADRLEGAIFGVIVTLLLFGIVVLHELGHAFTALEFGVPIKQIVLLPIGGVAQLERMPEEPVEELLVAVAGPAVNLVLGILLWIVARTIGVSLEPRAMLRSLQGLGSLEIGAIYQYVFAANLFLGVFNLLPAFPMDGGRVLRAFLASWMDYARATTIAVSVGQTMAWIMGLWGFLGGGFFLILIAIFIYVGASQEGQSSELRRVLTGLTVAHAYSQDARSLSPDDSVQLAVELTLTSPQADFAVCDQGRLVGVLTQKRLLESVKEGHVGARIGDVMATEFQTVSPNQDLLHVQKILAESDLDALPVEQDGRYLGLIALRDISEVFQLASANSGFITSLRRGRSARRV